MDIDLKEIPEATKKEVDHELQRLWQLALEDTQTRMLLSQEGVNVESIDEIGENPFTTETKGGNRVDIPTAIMVGIAVKVGSDIGSKAILAVWEMLIKPQLEKRFACAEAEDENND